MRDGRVPAARIAGWSAIAAVLFAAVCAWRLTENIIFGDEGFFLVIYDWFLREPDRVARAAATFWLTDVIGALWLRTAPMPGIIAVRVGALVADVGAAAVTWSIARRLGLRMRVWPALFAIGLALASGYIYLEYTVLTSLVLAGASALVLEGLRRDRPATWLVAGALLGVGVFLRLPNVLLPTLVVAPIVCAALERRRLQPAMRQSRSIAAGVVIGLAAGAALVLALHGADDIRRAIGDMIRPAGSAHAPGRLLHDIVRTIVLAGGHGAGCWILAAAAATAGTRWPAARRALGFAAIAVIVAAHVFIPGVDWRYSVLGLTALALVVSLVAPGIPAEVRRTALLAAWSLALLGAGSASLPWPLLAGLWLALPVAFVVFTPAGAITERGRTGDARTRLLRVALVALILLGVLPIRPYLAAIAGARPALWPHELDVMPHDDRLRPLHTSAALAAAADGLLAAVPRFVRPGDALITTNGAPLVTFLAGARPFFPHPYIDIAGVARFEQYEAAAEWRDPWPAWIRAKVMPTADFAVAGVPGSTFADTRETREAVAALLMGRGYTKAWENDLFEIWMPPREHAPRAAR